MFEDFKNHPTIKPLIKGGTTVEYSGHVVPEGGFNMIPKLIGDGVLVVGDAAGFCINIGYAVRGMDLAVASAEAAAKAVLAAKEKSDFSESSLSTYKELLDASFVMKDMNLYKKFPQFMENERIFNDYPKMLSDMMQTMFVVDGVPNQSLRKAMMPHIKKVGVMNLLKDAIKGVRSL
jgi:electron transfer flavoprotein-quinone oxidoreductase